jgi:nucleotide-binding universal stress UspA family protein
MMNLLVVVDRSLEASFALRTVCLFGTDMNIKPIYVVDPPGRDMAFGAGWARKSWKQETSRLAEERIGDLVLAERTACPNIHDPAVLTGDAFQEPADYFWSGHFDLLVAGAPFKGLGPMTLCRRFGHAARKGHRALPLMVVRHLKALKNVVALTDGSDLAENALGLLLKINYLISGEITLVGTCGEKARAAATETLNLERGLAILNEKGVRAAGHTASDLGIEALTDMVRAADLLVNPGHGPGHGKDLSHIVCDLQEDEIQAVLLYLNGH